jgi:hypothetical protein
MWLQQESARESGGYTPGGNGSLISWLASIYDADNATRWENQSEDQPDELRCEQISTSFLSMRTQLLSPYARV